MTISYNWLARFLSPLPEPQKLSRILTSIGLEVESMEERWTVPGGLEGVVVGEVVTCEKHPNADKLKVTTVNIGEAENLQVVCGAANVAAGQKILLAKAGATIYPTAGEPLTLKKTKIRGEESCGMICAEDELGLGTSHEGILVLDDAAKPGTPAAEIFNIEKDVIYEIGLTPNRADAMSHYGTARDVAAWIRHHENRSAALKVNAMAGRTEAASGSETTIDLEAPELCPRYCGVNISGVTVGESPAWLRNLLLAVGVKPINNVVDATNFVLHGLGQPLHAFDADKLAGNTVIIRRAKTKEKFLALDGKERELTEQDLVIADEQGPVCIAGVYGGLNSGVSEQTKNVFLEAARFNSSSVRMTSLRHGLRTEAATRFEKGVDIGNTLQALRYAAALIIEIAGGQINKGFADLYPAQKDRKRLAVKYHDLKKISGKHYHPDAVKNILEALGFETVKENSDELRIDVPTYKNDIDGPADIAEEIMRIDGLDNIDIPSAIKLSRGGGADPKDRALRQKLSDYLTGAGFSEIFTNSITNSKYYSEDEQASGVKMLNSLSADLDMMRMSLLPSSLETVAHNINRRQSNLRFFEFGKTYRREEGKYVETDMLALVATGNVTEPHWQGKAKTADVFYLKGIVAQLGILAGNKKLADKSNLTEVDTATAKRFGIKEKVFYTEIPLKELQQSFRKNKIEYREVSKFPAVERDLAILVNKSASYRDIEKTVGQLQIPALKKIALFDVFESEKLGQDKKSLALNFVFADDGKTLEDSDTESFMKKITTALEKNNDAVIRS